MQNIIQYENELSSGISLDQIHDYLTKTMYGLFILAALRLYSFQFLWIINDMIAALIIKCLLDTGNRCIAIFSLINCMLSIVYSSVSPFFELPKTLSRFGISIHTVIVCAILLYSIIVYIAATFFSYMGNKLYTKIIPEEVNRAEDYQTFA
jgi:hypothetical protein